MKHRLPEIFQFKKTPGPGFCRVKGCRDTGHKKKFGLCHAHYQHAWRLCYEKASAYATLRDHAKGRGIEFSISRDYFDGLVDAVGFFEQPKTEFKLYPSFDRISVEKGYVPGNLRVCSVSENARKGRRTDYLPKTVQDHLREIREQRQAELEDARSPF